VAARLTGVDRVLAQLLSDRFTADRSLTAEVRNLVVGAFRGPDELAAVLGGAEPEGLMAGPTGPASEPAGAYLGSVTVAGFRGIGPATRLELPAGPGLTLVVGRNGSGKSSLAEGLEVLLTGDSRRWAGRSQTWKEGWRNLHYSGSTRVEAEFLEEGYERPTTVTRTWSEGDKFVDGTVSVERGASPLENLESLGWSNALDAHRPFLSYNELGSMLDEAPSKLYDAMAGILGLDDLAAAERCLAEARRARERGNKELTESLALLLTRLQECDDDRARRCTEALTGPHPNLDAIAQMLTGAEESPSRDLGLLRQVAALRAPDPARTAQVVADLRRASQALAGLVGTDADQARRTADIVAGALALHDARGDGDCPVCGRTGALDAAWHERAAAEADRLRASAEQADAAHAAAEAAWRAADELGQPSPLLEDATRSGIDTQAARAAWQRLTSGRRDPDLVAAVLEEAMPLVAEAMTAVRDAAVAELERRDDAWRPLALEVAGWLHRAGANRPAMERLPALKKAEKWLKDQGQKLRRERFAPIASEAARVWGLLRVQSNIDLGRVELTGSATQRKVALDVTVDGTEGTALGVMSQGELHALALSLFLPRATLPDSPFRFLVIDDPVQSMDPARVDGLARALDETAHRRQVIVFTHDDRLPEAVRRLRIDATVWEVARREGSVVELRACLDPVRRYLDDAHALARAGNDLSTTVARHVVPSLCRSALEAACAEATKRRRLGRGERHADVDALLEAVTSTAQWAALALLDDPGRSAEVHDLLDGLAPRASATFEACAAELSDPYPGDLPGLVRDARLLAEKLRGAPGLATTTLATVLFTDIVASADRAATLGDRAWRALLDEHGRLAAEEVACQHGVLIKETGDGILATFDQPGRAVRAAHAIRRRMDGLGMQVRAGLHTGEIEHRGDDIAGLAVVIAQRICDLAEPEQVLVSKTVTDLLLGSTLTFVDHGTYDLKGVPGRWPLLEVPGELAPIRTSTSAHHLTRRPRTPDERS
jgi:class 3 adenylate cyclase/energy-coupling factor transporter ATP-binding protein EcfA2